MTARRRVLFATPLMPPASGGAAIYSDALTRTLTDQLSDVEITVVTERMRNTRTIERTAGGRRRIVRIFPHFSHSTVRGLWPYVAMAARQLLVSLLPLVAALRRLDVVVIHGGFHIQPNFLSGSVRLAQRIRPTLLCVVDIRDQLAPPKRVLQFASYNQRLACGANASAHLARSGLDSVDVPVPIEPSGFTAADAETTCSDLGLEPNRFLFFSNGVNHSKNVDLALSLRDRLAEAGPNLTLAIAGRNRDTSEPINAAVKRGTAVVLGPLAHRQVLHLAKTAAATINLSPSEGVPRSTLEAIEVGARVLFPTGVPEFADQPYVADLDQLDETAERLAHVIAGDHASSYDIERHLIERVSRDYARLWELAGS